MANTRLIVKRLKAVKNVRKITRTMELIATARYKKALDRATQASAYTRKINEIVADLADADLEISHPLLQSRDTIENSVLLIITSNRGLCGGYNGQVLRVAMERRREAEASGENLQLEVSGKRGISYLTFQGYDSDRQFTEFDENVTFAQVDELASRYASDFIAGKIDRVDVAYMEFINAGTQKATVETLLPIGQLTDGEDASADGTGSATPKTGVGYEFLPSAEEILEEIVPAAYKARLFKCFLDAAVSEQIARRVAMKAATENADEMLGSLKQEYNRARQSAITSELAEIIGGAAALE